MKVIESGGRFDLKHNEPKKIIGFATKYTFQLCGNGTAKIHGSMNGTNWTWIADMASTDAEPDSFIGEHTWVYIKADITGTAKLFGNRG